MLFIPLLHQNISIQQVICLSPNACTSLLISHVCLLSLLNWLQCNVSHVIAECSPLLPLFTTAPSSSKCTAALVVVDLCTANGNAHVQAGMCSVSKLTPVTVIEL